MRKLLPVFLLLCACRETTIAWDQPINNNDGCKQFDTSTQAIGATEPSPEGFTAMEVQRVLNELPSELSGTWSQPYIDGDLTQTVQISYLVDPSKAELIGRPAGQGFSVFGPDLACPAGPLIRIPTSIRLAYSYDDTPMEWTFDTTVEAQAADISHIWVDASLDITPETIGPGATMMLDSLYRNGEDSTAQQPDPDELQGMWVMLRGSPVRGDHQLKGHWRSQAMVLVDLEWPNER